jgi:5-methylthioadenosine/S-adenosylhomocysteine deaminase
MNLTFVQSFQILTVDEKLAIKEAQEAAKIISQRAREDVLSSDSDIVQMMKEGYL